MRESAKLSFFEVKSDSLSTRLGRDFAAGAVLFREGEIGSEMFVIQEGAVKVTKRVGNDDRTIAVFGRGEFLGEMAILNNKPRSATATVIEAAHCLIIDGKTLETMLARNSEIALRLIKKLASRLDAADTLIQILLHPDPRARVMLGLKRQAEAFGESTPGGIKVHLSADALAREVGADIEDVYSVLARLRRLKIAEEETGEGSITLFDVGRLLEFLEFLEMPRRFEGT